MGTHPIFESDFDCLTEGKSRDMALFQQSSSSGSGSKNLVEFKCGKMSLTGTTVTADKRKGLLYIHREDQCTHLCWKDRTANKVEDDLMIFPNDAEFVAVPQCTTGRVFLLKLKEALNNPSSLTSGSRDGAPDPEALMQILQGANTNPAQIQQLQSLLQQTHRSQSRSSRKEGSSSSSSSKKDKKDDSKSASNSGSGSASTAATPATTTPAKSEATTPAAGGVRLEDLQNILSGLPSIGGTPTTTPAAATLKPIDLAEAMKADDIIPLLTNQSIRDKCIEHLPQDASIPKTESELKESLRSPQFKQACDAFSHALSTGQLGPALQQFGVSAAAVEAANKGDVRGFAEAMEKDAAEKSETEQMQTD